MFFFALDRRSTARAAVFASRAADLIRSDLCLALFFGLALFFRLALFFGLALVFRLALFFGLALVFRLALWLRGPLPLAVARPTKE